MKRFLMTFIALSIISCGEETGDPEFNLTLEATPQEGGTITSDKTTYFIDEIADITMTASAEYLLKEWVVNGKITTSSSGQSSLHVFHTIDGDTKFIARFIKKKYALTTSVEGEGTVSEKIIKAGASTDYNSGTIVELTASPNSGWVFKEWQGDLSGSENPKQITMDKPKAVKAVFETEAPFYLDENGVTIKARDWVTAGTTGELNGVTYEAVDIETLRSIFNCCPSNWSQYQEDITKAEERLSKVVTTLITDMSYLFSNAPTSNSESDYYIHFNQFNPDISSWDVSNVTHMTEMFKRKAWTGTEDRETIGGSLGPYAEGRFNQDISKWDVSNVKNMSGMFFMAVRFNQDLSEWDVSNVTDMSEMFVGAISFNQDISNWNVSNVNDMYGMFAHLTKNDKDNNPKDLKVGNWNVSGVNSMSYLLYESGINLNIGNWNVGNVTSMNGMLSGVYTATSSFSGMESWDVSKVTDMSKMFYGNGSFNIDIGNWDVSNVTNMSEMFYQAHSFNQDIGNWDVGKVTNMLGMFSGRFLYNQEMDFNQDITNWNVSEVTDMSGMFLFAKNFNQDIGDWDVNKVIDMNFMFYDAQNFNQDIGNWRVGNVDNMDSMFQFASSFNQDITKWCVNNISSEPDDFGKESGLSNSNKPNWGTCLTTATIWDGADITFTKTSGSDITKQENQDRLTSNVWITRGNDGGQIYNIAVESSVDKNLSPAGTKWAVGTIDQLQSLTFENFRTAVGKPKDVVGKNLVLHLTKDDIYLSVKFKSWESGKGGGFSYERSSK